MVSFQRILVISSTFLGLSLSTDVSSQSKPNIIVILADDLGWNDVSFHGSAQIPTPNIDALAYNGIILNSHYVPALCTPSRSSLMTGKYPTHTGMQHLVILAPEPWGLPLSERLMPQFLKSAGYSTHAVGKWHLGFHRKEYTPTYRGFDSHFGYWNGYQDYYDHTMRATFVPYKGYDMRRNMSIDWEARGKYSTDLFTEEAVHIIETHDSEKGPLFLYLAHLAPHTANPEEPFQAPDEEIAKFAHIEDPERRMYAAMVSKVDQSIGEVMSALRTKGLLHNSIVLFMSDNGAPTVGIHSNRGSNYPLKGDYGEGTSGVRGVAAVWSPLLKTNQRVSNQLMHISDWLPTFYSAAGLDVNELGKIDGFDMWKALSENTASPRSEVLHNIDPIEDYSSFRRGDWKYVMGTTQKGKTDEWYGETGRDVNVQPYDVEAVLNSKAGIAITGYITKMQVHEKKLIRMYENSSSNKEYEKRRILKLLSETTVTSLRHQAEVHCNLDTTSSTTNNTNMSLETACKPLEAPCLFNIRDDPCETTNLASSRPLVLHSLEESLERFRKTMVNPLNVPGDPMANPLYWNGTWVNWMDDSNSIDDMKHILSFPEEKTGSLSLLIILIAMIALSIIGVTIKLILGIIPQEHIIFSKFLFSKSKVLEISEKQKDVAQ
ncbi:hypothetical protein L9F63_012003 [Diploptera punctata]|uniref:Sulfatase N-terminal domain-containing protein n=1 Tax=Diploptera punctata TaxID=6984 RepID=A0AAD8AD76_DIPPU|nr:hypothetical protein L9F63_012003 [Diploptera punctata]